MRVERNTQPLPASPPRTVQAKPTRQAQVPKQQPQETWTQSAQQGQVEEREATSPERTREEVLAVFPGIAEGLSCSYLHLFRESAKRNPTTLFVPESPASSLLSGPIPNTPEKYVHSLLNQTQSLLLQACGELYRPIPIKLKVLEADKNNASYEWVEGKARLTLQTAVSLDSVKNPASLSSHGPFQGKHRFRRGVVDLISFVHEYGHALYDQILGVPARVSVNFANRSLSEGFAVLLELLALDHLATLEEFAEDRADLETRRLQRVQWLQSFLEGDKCPSKSAYAEGTEVMVNLYRQGGLVNVGKFVEKITPNKANSLHRTDKSYLQALCRPSEILKLID